MLLEKTQGRYTVKCKCGKVKTISDKAYNKNIRNNGEYKCGSCVQKNKTISKEQRKKISEKLTGRKLTQEHKDNISKGITPEQIKTLLDNRCENPFEGRKHTKESLEKISKSNKGKVRTPEMRRRYSESKKGIPKSDKHKERISKTVGERHMEGVYVNVNYETGTYFDAVKCVGKKPFYRSSYEKRAIEILEYDDSVEKYYNESIQIEYDFDGVKRYYIPDFIVHYVDGVVKLIEIKPDRRMERERVCKLKEDAAIVYCEKRGWLYEHWGEKELGV